MDEPQVVATEYEVAILPRDNINYHHYAIKVVYRGYQSWAVMTGGPYCLGTDGEWDYEPSVTSRDDDWLATHRFPLEEALRLAREAAPDVEVNGRTARQVADRAREAAG